MPMLEIRPQAGPQTAFLASSADLAIYGGSAGGGKSWALLLEAMRHTANPGYGAVLFRRTSPQIKNEGGLWDESGKLYPLAGATPFVGSLDWRFPSGANVGFRHLQHEATKFDWQGSQVAMIGFDELTHFTESQFFYMLSRNRSMCGVRPYVRATTNPDASSWVKRFLAPWIDRKFPDPARSGEVRWFVRQDGKIVWVPPGTPDAKSVTFVRASVFDNKALLERDPGYLANLKALPAVEQARLLHGDWDVVNEGLVYPDFGQAVVEPEHWPSKLEGRSFGGIDWGWNNPFGALEATLDGDDVLWVHWERHGSRITLSEHSLALRRDVGHDVRWYADPAGADQRGELRRAGHDIIPCVHIGQRPLESGISLVAQRIRSGRLKVLGSLGHLIDEAGKYRYEGQTSRPRDQEKPVDADNHLLAALRYMVVGIDRGRSVKDGRSSEAGEVPERPAPEPEAAPAPAEPYDHEASHWWGGDDD